MKKLLAFLALPLAAFGQNQPPQPAPYVVLAGTDLVQAYRPQNFGNPQNLGYQSLSAVIAAGGGLPSQTGQSGNFLTTNGTVASWAAVSGSGNVSNSGTPVLNQLAIWQNATTIAGITGLTSDSSGNLSANSLSLPLTGTSPTGTIQMNGTPWIHAPGSVPASNEYNFFADLGGNSSMTGYDNVIIGGYDHKDTVANVSGAALTSGRQNNIIGGGNLTAATAPTSVSILGNNNLTLSTSVTSAVAIGTGNMPIGEYNIALALNHGGNAGSQN